LKPTGASAEAAGLHTLSLSDLEVVPEDVTRLFALAEQTDPQFGLHWYRNLVQTVFTPPAVVRLHVLRRDGQAVAVLPVVEKSAGWGREVLALGNYYTSLFAPALAPEVNANELALLVQQAMRSHAPLKMLRVAPMAPEATGFNLLKAAMAQAGLVPFEYFCFGNWYLPVQGDADQYLATRPGEVRNTLRRMGKKFAAADGHFEIVTTPQDAVQAVAEFTRVYRTSWKQAEPYERFIPGLSALCAQQGWLRMGLARVGAQVVAAQLWIVAAGKASIYKLAYDPAFRQLSPGSLLTEQLMRHVIDQDKVREIDYLTGDDAYKNQWMSHRRERLGLIAFNPRTMSGLAGLVFESCARRFKPLLNPK
jgi:CelD/BcsL family acetyltransferase involved in cellulose biosynthesis